MLIIIKPLNIVIGLGREPTRDEMKQLKESTFKLILGETIEIEGAFSASLVN